MVEEVASGVGRARAAGTRRSRGRWRGAPRGRPGVRRRAPCRTLGRSRPQGAPPGRFVSAVIGHTGGTSPWLRIRSPPACSSSRPRSSWPSSSSCRGSPGAPSWRLGPGHPSSPPAGRPGPVYLWSGSTCTLLAWLGVLHRDRHGRSSSWPSPRSRSCFGRGAAPSCGTCSQVRNGARRATRRRHAPGRGGRAVAFVLVLLPSRQAVGEALLPFSSTVWYYANLARETALHGGFPTELPEWGTLRPFQVDYLPVTAHTAAAFALLPGLDMRLVLEAYRLAVLAALVAVAALLLPPLRLELDRDPRGVSAAGDGPPGGKLLAYRPETWALVPAAVHPVARRPRDGRALPGAWRDGRRHGGADLDGPRRGVPPPRTGRSSGSPPARLFASRGRSGLRRPSPAHARDRDGRGRRLVFLGGHARRRGGLVRADRRGARRGLRGAGSAADRPPLPPADDIPPGWMFTDDPTWDFNVAAVAPASVGNAPPDRFIDSRFLPRSILLDLARSRRPDTGRPRGPAALLCVAPILAWPWLDARRRRLVLLMVVLRRDAAGRLLPAVRDLVTRTCRCGPVPAA